MVVFIFQVAAPPTSQLSALLAFVWFTLLTASSIDNVDDNGATNIDHHYMRRTIAAAGLNAAELFTEALANMQCLLRGEGVLLPVLCALVPRVHG